MNFKKLIKIKDNKKETKIERSSDWTCPCGCPPDNCTCCCSKPEGCGHTR